MLYPFWPDIPQKIMISARIVVRKKTLSNGYFPIYLRVTQDRRCKYYKTNFNVTEQEWDSVSGKFKKTNSNYIQNNRLLLKIQDRALRIITELELEKEDFTLEDFDKSFRIERNPIRNSFFGFWTEIIQEMEEAGRAGNARANKDSYRSLKRFNKSVNLSFREITPAFLDKYEVFLRKRGGTDGGIGVRMRAIRAIYNRAIDRNIVKSTFYPFRAYKIAKLKGKGQKRALNLKQVHRIVNLQLEDTSPLFHSRNYFVFSFYTRGMNFADMMKLKWENVTDETIYYTRSKTKGNFVVKILPPVRKILDYYSENANRTKYVFPILLKDDLSPQQIEYRKSKTLKQFNRDLKEIGRICGIDKKISSYVARHSFANCLKQKGISTDIISESLGHQNLAVTQAYLKELDSSLLDEASASLLA